MSEKLSCPVHQFLIDSSTLDPDQLRQVATELPEIAYRYSMAIADYKIKVEQIEEELLVVSTVICQRSRTSLPASATEKRVMEFAILDPQYQKKQKELLAAKLNLERLKAALKALEMKSSTLPVLLGHNNKILGMDRPQYQ